MHKNKNESNSDVSTDQSIDVLSSKKVLKNLLISLLTKSDTLMIGSLGFECGGRQLSICLAFWKNAF